MFQVKGAGPNIPKFPLTTDHLRQTLMEGLYESKEPKVALDEGAAKSAKALGW